MGIYTTHTPFKTGSIATPQGLQDSVLRQIASLEKRSRITRVVAFTALDVASVCAALWTGLYAYKAFVMSGAFGYLSLIFSDGTSVVPYVRELALSLVESFPATLCAALLVSIAGCLWCTSVLFKGTRRSISA